MKYIICIYRVSSREEEFITKYELNDLVYLPRRNENILIEDECYRVVGVSTSLDIINNTQNIEIAVKDIPLEYDWWEV